MKAKTPWLLEMAGLMPALVALDAGQSRIVGLGLLLTSHLIQQTSRGVLSLLSKA